MRWNNVFLVCNFVCEWGQGLCVSNTRKGFGCIVGFGVVEYSHHFTIGNGSTHVTDLVDGDTALGGTQGLWGFVWSRGVPLVVVGPSSGSNLVLVVW